MTSQIYLHSTPQLTVKRASSSVSERKKLFEQKIEETSHTAPSLQKKSIAATPLLQNVKLAPENAQKTQKVVIHAPSAPLPKPITSTVKTATHSKETVSIQDSEKPTNQLETEVYTLIKSLKTDGENTEKIEQIFGKLEILQARNTDKKANYQALISLVLTCFVEKALPTSENEKALYNFIREKYSLPSPKNGVIKEITNQGIDEAAQKLLNSSSAQDLIDQAAQIKTTMERKKAEKIISSLTESTPTITEKTRKALARLVTHANIVNFSSIHKMFDEQVSDFYSKCDTATTPRLSFCLNTVLDVAFTTERFKEVLNEIIDSPQTKSEDSFKQALALAVESVAISTLSETCAKKIQFLRENSAHIDHVYNQGKDLELAKAIPNFKGICYNALLSDADKLFKNPQLKSRDFFKVTSLIIDAQKMQEMHAELSKSNYLKKQSSLSLPVLDEIANSLRISERPCPTGDDGRRIQLALDDKDASALHKACPTSGLIKSLKREYGKNPKNFIACLALLNPSEENGHAIGIQLDAETNTFRFFDINAVVASYSTAEECIEKLGEYLDVFYENDSVPWFDVLTRKS